MRYPAVIFIIPLYFIYIRLNVLDAYPGLVLAYLTGLLPFTIWLSRRFFDGLPVELGDAGLIDGCGRTRVLMRIVLPLSLPAVSTIGVLIAILAWGEFFGALILTGPKTVTAPVSMGNFISYNTNNWSALAARRCSGDRAAAVLMARSSLQHSYAVRPGRPPALCGSKQAGPTRLPRRAAGRARRAMLETCGSALETCGWPGWGVPSR